MWQIEQAFRLSKSDLRERPIYHYLEKRIRAHVLLCFVSLLVVKETERILKTHGYSLIQAIQLLGHVGIGRTKIGNFETDIHSSISKETTKLIELFRH